MKKKKTHNKNSVCPPDIFNPSVYVWPRKVGPDCSLFVLSCFGLFREALRKPLHKKHRVILALGNDNNSKNDVYSLVFIFSVYFWKKCDLSEIKQGCVRMAEMMNECKL